MTPVQIAKMGIFVLYCRGIILDYTDMVNYPTEVKSYQKQIFIKGILDNIKKHGIRTET